MKSIRPTSQLLASLLLLLIPTFILAQEAASTFQREVDTGLNFRNRLLTTRTELKKGAGVKTGHAVFERLLQTSIVREGDPFPYQLTILTSSEINASSYAGGQIFAEGGMAQLMGEDPGLWAAVLGHEIAHTRQHHQFRAHVRQQELAEQIDYYKRREAAGETSASWALLALRIGMPLANLKLSRDEEHEADRLGLFMMAEAGYHPDFAITGFRRIAARTGDQSKLSAFFASHPRWETREQRQLKAYEEAVGIFESHWPDVTRSPGGQPPVVATILGVSSEKLGAERKALVRGTINIRHARQQTIFVVVKFFHRGLPVPLGVTANEAYTINGTELEAGFKATLKSTNETTTVAFPIPSAAIGLKARKLKASLSVYDKDGNILDSSREFSVSFPD